MTIQYIIPHLPFPRAPHVTIHYTTSPFPRSQIFVLFFLPSSFHTLYRFCLFFACLLSRTYSLRHTLILAASLALSRFHLASLLAQALSWLRPSCLSLGSGHLASLLAQAILPLSWLRPSCLSLGSGHLASLLAQAILPLSWLRPSCLSLGSGHLASLLAQAILPLPPCCLLLALALSLGFSVSPYVTSQRRHSPSATALAPLALAARLNSVSWPMALVSTHMATYLSFTEAYHPPLPWWQSLFSPPRNFIQW